MGHLGLNTNGQWFLSVVKDFKSFCSHCHLEINVKQMFYFCKSSELFFCQDCGLKKPLITNCQFLELEYGSHEHHCIKNVVYEVK